MNESIEVLDLETKLDRKILSLEQLRSETQIRSNIRLEGARKSFRSIVWNQYGTDLRWYLWCQKELVLIRSKLFLFRFLINLVSQVGERARRHLAKRKG